MWDFGCICHVTGSIKAIVDARTQALLPYPPHPLMHDPDLAPGAVDLDSEHSEA